MPPRTFRVMTPNGDQPVVGRGARLLGVRVPPDQFADIHPGEDGFIAAAGEGMSVSPSFNDLPFTRVPERLRAHFPGARGKNEDRVFRHGDDEFRSSLVAPRLILTPDKPGHGVVAPATRMALGEYEDALAQTAPNWESMNRRWLHD